MNPPDVFFFDDCAVNFRDKLNGFLKREIAKFDIKGGSPVPRGFNIWPKVNHIGLRAEIEKLYKGEGTYGEVWANNKEKLKDWAIESNKSFFPKGKKSS